MKKIILLTLISFTFTACSSTSKTPLSPEEKAEAEYKKNYTKVASHTIKTRSGNLTVIDRIHNRYSDDTTASSMNLMIIRKSNTVKARAAQTAVFTATFALLILAHNSNHIGYEGPDLLDKHSLSGKPIKPNFANPVFEQFSPKVRDWAAKRSFKGNSANKKLFVQPGRFYLVYEKFNKRDRFFLNNEVSLFLDGQSGKTDRLLHCFKRSESHSLEEWQANDYELVRQTTNKQYDECLAQFKEDTKANTSKL